MPLPVINFLDIRRENARFHIGTSSGQENIVGMPVQGEHSRSDWLLQEFRDPPVVFGVEGADRDSPTSYNKKVSINHTE